MATRGVVDKGLKKDALGFVSSVVIGVASTAPGYSLAAVLTLVVAAVGLQAPAVLILAFVPMLFIAASYYYMNRADPDCGTTFSWVTRAMGPWAGWIGGWAIIVADIIVMANLAQIAGLYGFLLVGWDAAADSVFAVTLVGVLWIAVMTAICVIGIELSARTQVGLLGAEIITLALFAIVALYKVYSGDALDGPPARAQLVLPVRDQLHRRVGGRPARGGVHLLGLGQHGLRQRGDDRLRVDARQGGDRQHGDPRRHLRARGHGRDRLRGREHDRERRVG